jgi:hypothetical protein
MAKKLYIETVGCQMNVLDSELVVGSLRRQGYELVHAETEADVIPQAGSAVSCAGVSNRWLTYSGPASVTSARGLTEPVPAGNKNRRSVRDAGPVP